MARRSQPASPINCSITWTRLCAASRRKMCLSLISPFLRMPSCPQAEDLLRAMKELVEY